MNLANLSFLLSYYVHLICIPQCINAVLLYVFFLNFLLTKYSALTFEISYP